MKYIIFVIALLAMFASPASATNYSEAIHIPYLDDNDDNDSKALDIGFIFPFYGTDQTEFYVTTNGILSFDGADYNYFNSELPTNSYNHPALFPFWDDLHPDDTGFILYDTINSSEYGNPYGTDVLVVQWTNYGFYGTELLMGTFQVHLMSDGNITFNYNDLQSADRSYGTSATIGMQENGSSANYTQYSSNADAGIRSGYAISYSYDGSNYTASGASTDDFWDLLLYKDGVLPPSKPSNPYPSVGTITSTSPTISWSCENATNYTIRVSENAELSSPSHYDTTVPSLNLSGLSENTTYYWHVIAKNNGGETHSDLWNFYSVFVPVANFSSNVISGNNPLTVSFTDLSTNNPTSWEWDFGDGITSISQSPTHTYTSAGTYTVVLNATNDGGSNISTQTDYITVNAVSSGSGYRASVSPGQPPETVKSTETSMTHVMGGMPVEFDLSGGDDPVLGISFDAKGNEGLVVTKVQVLNSRPADVPAPQGNSYSVMSIDVGSPGTISEHNAENIIIHFKVSLEWIEENDIDVSTIRMARYHDEQWQDLPTNQLREEEEFIHFTVRTPGFSIFSVVGDKAGEAISEETPEISVEAEMAAKIAEPESTDTPNTPGFTGMLSLVFVTLAFLLVRKNE